MMKKKTMVLIFALIALLTSININLFSVGNNKENINLLNVKNAMADPENPVQCLVVEIWKSQSYFTPVLKCWQDVSGPDIFEGFTGTCTSGGTGGCNGATCKGVEGCYTTN